MYFLIMRNMTPIQNGIQALHGIVEYALKYFDNGDFQNFARHGKTVRLLNGGTSIQMFDENLQWLIDNNVNHATFSEPNFNGSLTAIAFLASPIVHDRDVYPNFDVFKKQYNNLTEEEAYVVWVEQIMLTEYNSNLRMFINKFKSA